MDPLAIGFWGAFFGSVALMLAGSLAAFARSLPRVALMASLSAVISAVFVVTYLGWFPFTNPAAETRFMAHIAVLAAVVLGLMLLAMLGLLRDPVTAGAARVGMISVSVAVLCAGWLLDAAQALFLGSLMAIAVGAIMLVTCVASARGAGAAIGRRRDGARRIAHRLELCQPRRLA
jgi:uncharacterized membrane protein